LGDAALAQAAVALCKGAFMVNLARGGLFVVCAWFSMVPYAYAFAYLSEHGPANHARAVIVPWMFFESMLPAALIAILVAYPLVWVYRRAAPWVAFALTVPFAGLRFTLIRPEAKALELAIAWATIAAYVIFVTGATFLARRLLVRHGAKREAHVPTPF